MCVFEASVVKAIAASVAGCASGTAIDSCDNKLLPHSAHILKDPLQINACASVLDYRETNCYRHRLMRLQFVGVPGSYTNKQNGEYQAQPKFFLICFCSFLVYCLYRIGLCKNSATNISCLGPFNFNISLYRKILKNRIILL
jgi:hypothetical protein